MHTNSPGTRVFRFGVFELDAESGELRRHGLRIRLPEQSLKILLTLLSHPGEVVARDELRHVLWAPDTFVDFEVGLNSAVRKLREALDDSADTPRFVETLPRRGYRFLGAVTTPLATPTPRFERVEEPEPGPASDPAAGGTPVVAVDAAPVSRMEAVSTAAVSSSPSQIVPAPAWPSRRMGVRAAGLALVALLLTAGAAYQRGARADLRPGSAAEPLRTLVVLPFENLTGDASQEAFVDTVTDAVTSHLAQVDGLNVTSRTSARRYKQTVKGLPEIGRELAVEGVVEGAVVRSGDGVRVSAKLIRAATDRHMWAQSYPGDVGQMLALQRQIAADVAVAAGRPMSPARAGAQRVDPKAYDAYVKGLTARGFQRYDGFRRAVAYFEEAVAIQPDFAEAYAALARAQVQFLFTGPLSPSEAVPKAEAAARKALELDPTLAHAHIALAQVLNLYYWRWDEGTKSLQRAVDSEKREGFTAVSESLIRHGRLAEGLAAAERTRALDPLSVNAQIAVGTASLAAGLHDRAVEEFRQALAMGPATGAVRFHLGVTYIAMGRLSDAIRELEIATRSREDHQTRFEGILGHAYALAGRGHDARAILKELELHRAEQYVSSFGIALIHDALGEKALALAALRRAQAEHAVEFGLMTHYPPFRAIASDPGFRDVMRQLALPDERSPGRREQ
jgi:TolB-like protein/DNA-binding winged helix-turn-helix (wHTH) protein/tetratricopeptide (TPR) repeat protein